MAAPPEGQQDDPPAGFDREGAGKLAESLAKGVTLLTAALGVAAAYRGGVGRIAINEGTKLTVGLALVVLGILLAVVAWALVVARPGAAAWWTGLTILAVVCSIAGIATGLAAARTSAEANDRPTATAGYDGKVLTFTGEIALLPADDFLTVTVTGYPPNAEQVPLDGHEGEDRGSQLFMSTTGPDPDGTAKVEGSVPLKPSEFEQVEVRVYRGGADPNCLDTGPGHRTACIQVWLQPRPPALTAAPPTSP